MKAAKIWWLPVNSEGSKLVPFLSGCPKLSPVHKCFALILHFPPTQRAMCAIYSLMCSDLVSHDQIFAITQQHLQDLSQECPGPVANKATKVIPASVVSILHFPHL